MRAALNAEGMEERPGGFSAHRLETLCDSIFAVAMTLLVLDIRPPTREALAHASLVHLFLGLSPKITAFVVSFMVLGVGWSGHYNLFHYVKKVNRQFLWMNIVFLMGVVFIPFSTSVLGEFGDRKAVVFLFGLNLNFTAFMLYWMWGYAASRRLVEPNLDLIVVRLAQKRILSGILLYFLVMGLSFINARLCVFLFLIIPLFYIMPGKLDRYFNDNKS